MEEEYQEAQPVTPEPAGFEVHEKQEPVPSMAAKSKQVCSSQEQIARSNSFAMSPELHRKATNEDDEQSDGDFLGDRLSNVLITEEEAMISYKQPSQ